MCCFSQKVEAVKNTRIFARPSEKERQFIVYSMKLTAKEDVAMILPIPTPPKSAEDAVKFISLKDYADFFDDLHKGFPVKPPPQPITKPGFGSASGGLAGDPLPVVDVGNFEASFVPTVDDFSRLDERFRLPEGTWGKLPGYKNFGFAVFKLKSGDKTIHPMAFEFPRAKAHEIFFPTVHIHDGEVHERADYDHTLYLQPAHAHAMLSSYWTESAQPAGMFMDMKKSAGLFDAELHCYRRIIKETQKNRDIVV